MAALIADGADVNEPKTGGSGVTALYVACMKGHTEIVATLLAANANANEAQHIDGVTPLYIACQNGHGEGKRERAAA